MPLLSLAHALKKASKSCRVVYIGQKNERLSDHLKDQYKVFDEIYYIPAGKLRRYHGESLLAHLVDLRTLALNSRDFFRVLAGTVFAKRYLKQIRPDVVFSKGGFVAVPVGIAAARLKIPIVTHDSDTVPGLANRIVGRYASLRTSGMPTNTNSRFVGIPINETIKPVDGKAQAGFKKEIGVPDDSLILLIGGAGLGARDMNDKVLAIADRLFRSFGNLFIIHIAGYKHTASVNAGYQKAAPDSLGRVKVIDFTPEFYKYTGAADLIVTRAGATTIAELAVQGKAVILIPAPHLAAGHQLKNATEVQKAKAALVVNNDAKPDRLFDAINQVLTDKNKKRELAANLAKLAHPAAANKLARILLDAASQK